MSLRSKFNVNSAAAANGVWIDYPDLKNKDGSIPGFLVARMTKHNKKYAKAFRKATESMPTDSTGVADTTGLSDDESEELLQKVFVDGVLLNWRNFEPNDDGKKKKYAKKVATEIFTSMDWWDLYMDLSTKAGKAATFNVKKMEKDAKN
jgi:hypothetical protein